MTAEQIAELAYVSLIIWFLILLSVYLQHKKILNLLKNFKNKQNYGRYNAFFQRQ